MALAGVEDVEAVLVRALTDSELPHVDRLLDMASAKAEQHCGRRFARVAGDVVVVGRYGDTSVFLPSPPVETISGITIDGSAVAVSSYEWTELGALTSLAGLWAGALTVTYTHGFDPIPDDVALGVAAIVAELLEGPGPGVRQESIDGYSVGYFNSGGLRVGPTAAEALEPYRLVVTSIPVETGATW